MIKHYFIIDTKTGMIKYHTFGKKRGNTRTFNLLMNNYDLDHCMVGPIHTHDSKSQGHNYGVVYNTGILDNNIISKLTQLAEKMQAKVVKPNILAQWHSYLDNYNNAL